VTKTSGEVRIFDYNIDTHHESAKQMIGVVPQEFNFNMFEKVQDIIITQAGYFGIEREDALPGTEELLKQLGLFEKRSASARSLSGGMKRRLMIARALIHRPKLLILDEPTAGVDVELRYSMWDYLRELNESGTTILLTTHYLEEVEQMCRNAAIIKDGAVIRNDKVKNLIKFMDKETYIVTTKEKMLIQRIQGFQIDILDDITVEVDVDHGQTINDFIVQLTEQGIAVMDIRPKGHRLEKLFLKLLKE
jgi:ABC-2 type transport system ATP-binding protein